MINIFCGERSVSQKSEPGYVFKFYLKVCPCVPNGSTRSR